MARYDDENDEKKLVDQQYALTNYLDSLFRDIPAIEADVPALDVDEPSAKLATKVCPLDEPQIESPLISPQERPSQFIEQHFVKGVCTEQVEQQEALVVELQAKVENVCDDSVPVSYYHPTQEFQVLFFQIGKLNLAVPLEHLSGVLKVASEKVIPVPGYAPWHLGLMRYQGSTVNIVDTAKLIVPSHRKEIVEDRRSYRYFILLDERRWGLGCHAVADVVTLQPIEVKWRNNRTLQPWLAGTIIEKMCALIDVEGFLRMLHQHRPTKL